jgi:hypothetical protein
MTRLFLLLAAVLSLNACEQHKADELPAELREGKKHGVLPAAQPSCCTVLAAAALTTAR